MPFKGFRSWLTYRLGCARYEYHMMRRQRQHQGAPILIHQMGKVGSKSIRSTLQDLNLDRRIYHTHHLAWHRIAEIEDMRREFFGTERESSLHRAWLSRFIRKQLDKTSDQRWKVITLTRDPIARNLSGFFENIDFKVLEAGYKFEIQSHYYEIPPTIVTLDDMPTIIELFHDRYRHDTPIIYFDEEIKDVFGIDVYATEFPREAGYDIYRGRNVDLLVLRLEDLNHCAGAAFKESMGLPDFTLARVNVGGEKDYAAVYKKFKDSIQLPDSYLEKFYDSKYVRHFYGEEEIENFRDKWRKNAVS